MSDLPVRSDDECEIPVECLDHARSWRERSDRIMRLEEVLRWAIFEVEPHNTAISDKMREVLSHE